MALDDDLIPRGDHCYHTWAASDPATRQPYLVIEPHDTCPFWRPTAHGTIRCEHLGVEAVIEAADYDGNLRLATAALGAETLARIRSSATFLPDQIKICNIHPDVPGFEVPEGGAGDVLTWKDG